VFTNAEATLKTRINDAIEQVKTAASLEDPTKNLSDKAEIMA